MTSHGDTCTAPSVIPGVVDGSLMVCREPDHSVSFHLATGSDGDRTGRRVRIEFVLTSEHAALLREALAEDGRPIPPIEYGTSVPCYVGILVGH